MPTKRVEAFQIAARIEVDNRRAQAALRDTQKEATKTIGLLGRLKGAVGGVNKIAGGVEGGGLLGGVGEALKLLPGLGTLASGLAKVASVGQSAVSFGFDFNRTMEEGYIAFEVLLKDGNKAKKLLSDIDRISVDSPFDFAELVDATPTLLAFQFRMGEITRVMTAAGDASRGQKEKFDGIILSLGQMKVKGKVSAEEMLQLVERGVPAWKYLGDEIAKVDKKFAKLGEEQRLAAVQKMAERGLISSKGAVEAILRGIEDEFGGLGKRVANETASGLESQMRDAAGRTLGPASRGMFSAYKDALRLGIRTVGSETVQGLAEGIGSGTQQGVEAMKKLAGDLVEAARSPAAFDINSPSKKFIPIGEAAAEGVAVGFRTGMERHAAEMFRAVDSQVAEMEGLLNGRRGRGLSLPQVQDRRRRNLDAFLAREPDFLPKLKRESARRNINPDDMLNLMSLETAGTFRKDIHNGMGYVGLIQFGEAARRDVGLPRGVGAAQRHLRSISAADQLDYVFKYLDARLKAFYKDGVSLAQLYASVGAGHATRDDSTVMFRAEGFRPGDDPKNRKISRAGFFANPSWNVDGNSVIQQWEFGAAARRHLGAGARFTVNDPGYVVPVRGGGSDGAFARPYLGGDLRGGLGMFIDEPADVRVVDGGNVMADEVVAGLEPIKLELADLAQAVSEIPYLPLPADDTPHAVGGRAGSRDPIKGLVRNKSGLFRFGVAGQQPEEADADGDGEPDRMGKVQGAVFGLKSAAKEVKNLFKDGFADFAQGIGGMVEDFVLLGETGPGAMKKLVASVLAGVAAQSAVLAVFELAKGFASLFFNPAEASAHFTAAALFGSIAGVTAVAGRTIAGDSFKDKPSEQSQQQQNEAYADPANPANQVTRRWNGGPGYRGRAYIVGDGGRPEVFEPEEDGYIHPSVEAYERARAIRRKQRSLERGGLRGMEKLLHRALGRLADQLERMESMPPGEVVRLGAPKAKREIAGAYLGALDSHPKLIEQTNRRLQPA